MIIIFQQLLSLGTKQSKNITTEKKKKEKEIPFFNLSFQFFKFFLKGDGLVGTTINHNDQS